MKAHPKTNPPQSLPPLSIDQVAASMRRIQAMSQQEKETICDDLAKLQPNLLAHVLALSNLDVPIEKVDQVLHILIVLHDVFTSSTLGGLAEVSEAMLESVDQNQQALLILLESEEPSEAKRLCQLAVKSHPEVNAFAFANGKLFDSGISDMRKKEDMYCVRAVRNLVDAFSRARRPVVGKETRQ